MKVFNSKKQKIKLIREIEKSIGLKRFKVNIESSEEDIDNVFGYICNAAVTLKDFESKIELLLNENN